MSALDSTALEVVAWHDREWPSPDGTPAEVERICMKLTEEVGELQGAIVKHLQGRTDEDWLAEAEKEYGDVLIVLCVLADRLVDLHDHGGQTPEQMLAARWAAVSKRRGASYRPDVRTLTEAIASVMSDPEFQDAHPDGANAGDVLEGIRSKFGTSAFPLVTVIDVADGLREIYGRSA